MIIDTSAVLAVLLREPDAARYEESIINASRCRMSVANALEATMVIEGRGGQTAGEDLDAFLGSAAIELMSVTREQLDAARDAWRRFGRGNHPAKLNYGDCFAYALAKVSGEALLYKGDDFSSTDIPAALPAEREAGA